MTRFGIEAFGGLGFSELNPVFRFSAQGLELYILVLSGL